MKKTILACFSAGLIAVSCSKDDNPDPTPAAEQYMTITTNSKWTYDVTTDPGTGTASTVIDTVTVTATDTIVEQGTANQRTYRIFKHTNGNASSYYNISGNEYYEFQGFAVSDVKLQNLYLKDNQPVGTTWNQTVIINDPAFPLPVPILITNTIIDKGISKTVNGNVYSDVIGIRTDISSTLLPGGIVTDIRSYYARKVGLIEGNYKVDISAAMININTQTLLKTAVIL